MADRTLKGKDFYNLMKDAKFDEAVAFLQEDPGIIWVVGWLSMSFDGGWGMPQYKHFGALLQDPPSPVYTALPKAKTMARAICAAYSAKKQEEYGLLLAYALVADWPDVAQECIDSGLDFAEKGQMQTANPETMSEGMRAVWDAWTETRIAVVPAGEPSAECCICFDAKTNAYFTPCGHTDFCFECSRNLTSCPICRSEGYAKLQQRQSSVNT